MRYIVDMAIFGTLADFIRAVLVARELDNTRNTSASRHMLRKARRIAGYPHLTAWQDAYSAFGIGDTPGGRAEYRRSRGVEVQSKPFALSQPGEDTPLGQVLSAFALQNLLPAGGDDLDRIVGNVWLRPARGNELFVPAGQPERPETPAIGEIVYVDDGPYILRRRWHGPAGDTARITTQTRNALLYLDCLPPIDRAQAEKLAGSLARLVSGFFGAQVETHFLTREQPAIAIQ